MNQKIILKSRPEGMPSDKNFEITEAELTTLSEGEVRVKALYISVDPYMRGRMSSAKSYAEPFEVGKAIVGGVVARVTESQSAEFKKDDIVFGMMKWQQIQDVPAAGLRLIQRRMMIPLILSAFLECPDLQLILVCWKSANHKR
ncbi:hypothetical protein MASR1M74_03120 [Lentimicrobium sp.]